MPRILVVDDDPMVCIAIEVCLQRHGYEVIVADGGEAGINALEASAFDLMLVDIFMPHMRGFEIDQDIPRTCAGDSADRRVRLRFCEFRYALARLPSNDP